MNIRLFSTALLLLFFCLSLIANAQPVDVIASIDKSPNYSSIVVRVSDGKVLYSHNAEEKRYPASLVKMMTLYLVFDALKNKKLKWSQKLTASKKAAMQPKSHLGLKVGEKITVRQAVIALIVKSANDCAVILAESIAGSEEKFALMMNRQAKKLKMLNTKFCNSHGLHDPDQYTNAKDMVKLLIALKKDFPKYYHLLSKTSFKYKGDEINSHNNLLNRYSLVGSGKTGYIKASFFNVAVLTSDNKLAAVVMGGQTARIRDDHMIKILDENYQLIASNGI